MTTPLVGTTVSLIAGMVILSVAGFGGMLNPKYTKESSTKRGLLFFALAGLASFGGVYANYFALSITPMVIVSPLLSTNPLFTLFLAFVFLKRLEKITPQLVVSAFLIIGGGILIVLGRVYY